MPNLQRDLENSPWQLIDQFDDPDDSLWCWETYLNALYLNMSNKGK